jgi:hypothetical protein
LIWNSTHSQKLGVKVCGDLVVVLRLGRLRHVVVSQSAARKAFTQCGMMVRGRWYHATRRCIVCVAFRLGSVVCAGRCLHSNGLCAMVHVYSGCVLYGFTNTWSE